jgi:hypothetical protein
MRNLSALELLEVWERGFSATPVERALIILNTAYPDESWESLTKLSIGARDSALLKIREETFGPRTQVLCDCPRCDGTAETSFDVGGVIGGPQGEGEQPLNLRLGEYNVRFRLPDSRDLAAVVSVTDKALAVRQLFERCVIDARHGDSAILPEKLPSLVADAVADRIARAEPQSDIELQITCPVCEHSWVSPFDISTFFWSEIVAAAQGLLRDVHRLALAYGWSEEAILAMSAARRQAYLEMVSL